MRYHIASLVAVFLALTVGIVLGTAIVNRGVLVQQQSALVSGLREEFSTLRDRNRILHEELSNDDQFFQSVLPLLVSKRLVGKRVVVVSNVDENSANVRQAVIGLRQAGAKVNVMAIQSADLGTKDPATTAKLEKIYLREKLSGEALRDRLISDIATQLATRTEPAFLNQLSNLAIITVSATDALPAQAAVFVADSGNGDMVSQVQVPLLAALKKTKLQLVGVESTTLKESAVVAYQKAGVSTVDNIDSPIGEVSLVYSLSGSPGNYGVKETADALAPKLGAR